MNFRVIDTAVKIPRFNAAVDFAGFAEDYRFTVRNDSQFRENIAVEKGFSGKLKIMLVVGVDPLGAGLIIAAPFIGCRDNRCAVLGEFIGMTESTSASC